MKSVRRLGWKILRAVREQRRGLRARPFFFRGRVWLEQKLLAPPFLTDLLLAEVHQPLPVVAQERKPQEQEAARLAQLLAGSR